ncbi:MAG: threonine--tRNA ligase [Candidatus Niyogibacteria bacterium]|nr:threonine--tRNA ligase [Candidatus Niyogibacteria bacterium]
MANQSNIDYTRHSLSHLLAMAVLKKFPKAKLGIGPTIENGFYYDFLLPKPITPDDLKEFEKEMRILIEKKLGFTGKKTTPAGTKKILKNQPFKQELIKDFAKEKKQLTLYTTGHFTDLCKGGHVKNTAEINPEAFTLTKIAGAYWKGNEKNPQLTRIYGVAFGTKKELDEYLAMQAEAEKRDHKKLGVELGLFTTSELVGQGLPLFTPKGTVIRDMLERFIEQLNKEHGYQKIWIPHLARPELYKTSGHWDKFQDNLFHIKGKGSEFVLKPMNCPHHTQIYASEARSYRDLPIRFFETTTVYRDEKSGELGGLTRVRSITQDDGHVFFRGDQLEQEFDIILSMQKNILEKVGLTDYWVSLSLRDPKNKKAYLGDDATWNKAERAMTALLQKKKINFKPIIGEAAFYGPKMDLMVRDSLGREWQLSTVQLDLNMPKRFGLEYIDEQGKKQTPVMIHRAFMGSTERFIGILIEHFAGAFPLWLAPVQITILTLNEKVSAYANEIKKELEEKNIRVSLDDRNESIGKKIRGAELQKIPYAIIIGEKEQQSKTISIRARGKKDLGTMPFSDFLKKIEK